MQLAPHPSHPHTLMLPCLTSSCPSKCFKLLLGPGCCSMARCASSRPSMLVERKALRHRVPLRVLLLLM